MKRLALPLMAALLCTALFACGCSSSGQGGAQGSSPSQQESTPVEVVIPLAGSGFDGDCTKLPVRVVGNDEAGKQIDEVAYVDADGKGIELAPGDYSLAVCASPLSPSGRLFAVPTEAIGITIPESSEAQGAYEVPTDQAWTLEFLAPDAMSEEQLQLAYDYAKKSPGQEELADELYQTTQQRFEMLNDERAEAQAALERFRAQEGE